MNITISRGPTENKGYSISRQQKLTELRSVQNGRFPLSRSCTIRRFPCKAPLKAPDVAPEEMLSIQAPVTWKMSIAYQAQAHKLQCWENLSRNQLGKKLFRCYPEREKEDKLEKSLICSYVLQMANTDGMRKQRWVLAGMNLLYSKSAQGY